MTRRGVALVWAALAALLLTLAPRAACAHAIGLSTGEYTMEGRVVRARLVLARGELLGLYPALDRARDGLLTADELEAGRGVVGAIAGRLEVTAGAAPCPGELAGAAITEQDGVAIDLRYTCPEGASRARARLLLLADLPRGHRHLARELSGARREDILFGERDALELEGVAPTEGAVVARPSSFVGFVWMGVEHILTGYDHLVFLFGLVLVPGRPRALVAVVTAFTVAHSITLGLSVLGVVTPRSALVEPAIALSIVYVGVESLFVKSASGRWRITFPFGLVHGFGFAGALRELELPRARVPYALVAFNLGVELAQLAALAIVVPLVLVVTARHTRPRVTRGLSLCVALAGATWLVVRLAGA